MKRNIRITKEDNVWQGYEEGSRRLGEVHVDNKGGRWQEYLDGGINIYVGGREKESVVGEIELGIQKRRNGVCNGNRYGVTVGSERK